MHWEDHRAALQLWDDPLLEVQPALGGHPLKWVLALSVGALSNSILLAHTNFVSWSNEIFKGNYKKCYFQGDTI